jgi:hypothetical protein
VGKYIGSWKIDDILQHKVQTSSVTTGAATDADAVPTWRVYEDSTTTPVTTGSYTTFNSLAGFYNAAITLAAAIGYEKGKNYYIRYSATVASIIGADVDTFQIEAEVDANSVSITVNANVSSVSAGSFQSITIGSVAATVNANVASVSSGAFQSVTIGSVAGTVGSVAAAVTVNATSQAAIVDAVWAETAAGYTTAGSMGYQLAQADSIGALVNAIWDEPKANHTTADTYGEYLDGTITAIAGGSSDTTVSPTAIAAIADAVWDETGADHVSAGSFGARLNVSVNSMTAGAIGPVTVGSTSQSAIAVQVTAGSIGAVTVGSTSASAIATATQALALTLGSTAVAAIQSGLATAAALDTVDNFLDTEIAAIKAKTDLLFAGTTNSIAVDIRFVNGVSVTGNGQSGTEWGPGS